MRVFLSFTFFLTSWKLLTGITIFRYRNQFFPTMSGGYKGASFCGTPAKKLQNLRPAATKIIILRLRHHQDSQVVIYINPKIWFSGAINQKMLFSGKRYTESYKGYFKKPLRVLFSKKLSGFVRNWRSVNFSKAAGFSLQLY